jgi:hypothetical protein
MATAHVYGRSKRRRLGRELLDGRLQPVRASLRVAIRLK